MSPYHYTQSPPTARESTKFTIKITHYKKQVFGIPLALRLIIAR